MQWRVGPDDANGQPQILDGGALIAIVCHECVLPRKYVLERAHLIAATPDLLKACELMQKSLNGNPGDFTGMLGAHRAIDTAVRKAKGGA